ncbi:Photosystem I P700 chlorophyll a apoprotein A1 [Linum perenne]
MYFHGARFSNYEAWLSDPTHIRPSAQVVWPIVGQEILNGDIWRASGITSELQLYCTAIGALVFAALMLFCWLVPLSQSCSKIGLVPRCRIYVESPFSRTTGTWGATPFFTLNWSKYSEFLTFRGGLDPVTGGLWLTDIAHHHLAIAILFLIAGHMYRTNWGIGHSIKDILESHKGPFTGQGHKGLYEILTNVMACSISS